MRNHWHTVSDNLNAIVAQDKEQVAPTVSSPQNVKRSKKSIRKSPKTAPINAPIVSTASSASTNDNNVTIEDLAETSAPAPIPATCPTEAELGDDDDFVPIPVVCIEQPILDRPDAYAEADELSEQSEAEDDGTINQQMQSTVISTNNLANYINFLEINSYSYLNHFYLKFT